MRKNWVLTAVLGLGLVGGSAMYLRAADADEGKEVKVKLSDCPAAVRKTIDEQSKGAKTPVESVDKETGKDGKVIYEADATIDGVPYEIQVAEDGSLIGKKVDKEETEKKDGEKKGEKEEKK
jgi:hypothetical protein